MNRKEYSMCRARAIKRRRLGRWVIYLQSRNLTRTIGCRVPIKLTSRTAHFSVCKISIIAKYVMQLIFKCWKIKKGEVISITVFPSKLIKLAQETSHLQSAKVYLMAFIILTQIETISMRTWVPTEKTYCLTKVKPQNYSKNKRKDRWTYLGRLKNRVRWRLRIEMQNNLQETRLKSSTIYKMVNWATRINNIIRIIRFCIKMDCRGRKLVWYQHNKMRKRPFRIQG